jgi:hypothetical protein
VREPNTFTPVYSPAEGLRSRMETDARTGERGFSAALFAALLLGVFYER